MPQVVVAAVASGIASGFSITAAGTIAFSLTTASFLTTTAISLAMGALSYALSPKPKQQSFDAAKGGLSQQFRQAVTARQVVYGEVRKSGPVTFIESTGDNKYLHYIITLATHEIQSVDEIIVSDESITPDMLDGSGFVTSGTYQNIMRIKIHLGSSDQTADTDLVAEVSRWTSFHRQRGNAYVYIRLEWNRDKFPSGLPNLSFWLRGKKCIDTRAVLAEQLRVTESDAARITEDGQQRYTNGEALDEAVKTYTPNIALQAYDHITDSVWGIGAAYDRVDQTACNTAANICDEFVSVKELSSSIVSADTSTDIITLSEDVLQYQRGDKVRFTGGTVGGLTADVDYYVVPYQRQDTPRIKLSTSLDGAITDTGIVDITGNGAGTLTKIAEPRYHGGGVLSMDAERGKNLQEVVSGMAGTSINTGGLWSFKAGAYETPTLSFDSSDLAGTLSVIQTRFGRKARFNRVQGLYSSVINKGNLADYPIVTSATYETADGEALDRNLDLPFTQREQTSQRIAKLALELSRREIIFEATFKMSAFKLRSSDNFYFTFPELGWTNKVFQVTSWRFYLRDSGGVPEPVIDMTCREIDSAAYAFTSASDETSVLPAPRTNLPNAFDVTVVTGFNLNSIPVATQDGDKTFKIAAAWDEHPDSFVLEDGGFELQFKISSDTAWKKFPIIDGAAVSTDLFQAEPDTLYDVRIRAINNRGATSNFTTILNFRVGSTGGITDTEDWEFETKRGGAKDWESDTLSSEDWE